MPTAPPSSAELVTLRDRFIARFNESSQSKDPYAKDLLLQRIIEEYRNVTFSEAARRKDARFVVLDESGYVLENVHVDIRRVRIVGWLDPGLKGDHEDRIVSGEFNVAWPRRDSTLELKFRKEGYRSISVDFRPRKRKEEDQDDRAREWLEKGHLLPPTQIGGPMRVILPPNLIWPPDERYQSTRSHVPVGWSSEGRPQQVEVSATPLMTSNDARRLAVMRRGTYVLVDRNGKVIQMVGLDAGNLLGLTWVPTQSGVRRLGASHLGGGLNFDVPPDSEPYQWQFYGEPKRVPRQ